MVRVGKGISSTLSTIFVLNISLISNIALYIKSFIDSGKTLIITGTLTTGCLIMIGIVIFVGVGIVIFVGVGIVIFVGVGIVIFTGVGIVIFTGVGIVIFTGVTLINGVGKS